MSVLIGHASIDENGKVAGGQPGDQTEKEVCTRQWYDKGWNVLLRPDPAYAEALARACEAGCKNNNIGYSQTRRNTLYAKLTLANYNMAKVEPCECDCSSFMTCCGIAAGIKALEYVGNAPTTKTMKSVFRATNKFAVIQEAKYLRSDEYLKRGDILVKESSHTAMVLQDGPKAEKIETPEDFQKADIRSVVAVNLNARISPKNGSKLFILNAGDLVHVVEQKDGWCKIEAWVSSQYLVK